MKSTFHLFASSTTTICLLFAIACNNRQSDENTRSQVAIESRNEAAVHNILAVMDAGDPTKFDQYCTSDYQINNPFLPQPGNLEVFKGLMAGQKGAFPDVRHEVVQMFSKGNMVCVRGVFSGTNTGPMQDNPPTGNRVVIPFIFTDEFDESGKLKIRHVQFDTRAFNEQLMAKKSSAGSE